MQSWCITLRMPSGVTSWSWIRTEMRQYRRDNALTLTEMAARVGLSRRTVAAIEAGKAGGLAPRTVKAWLALRPVGDRGAEAAGE